ncbi:predicted protein [Botrytis cinerea T4]|uniref:Uncharacterized protein n=1 Tax=Botryotinia fuckeliana (strain T4) TaxID=999810 RepID=G2YNC7_BOTF4|nr:predicted protein [Botrytis cinerea T4]
MVSSIVEFGGRWRIRKQELVGKSIFKTQAFFWDTKCNYDTVSRPRNIVGILW